MTEQVVTKNPRKRHPLPGFEHNIVWGKKRNRTSGEQIWKQRCSHKNTSTILEQIAMAFAGAGTSAQDMIPQIQRYTAAYQDAKQFSMDSMAQRSNMPPSMQASMSQSMGYPGNMFPYAMHGGHMASVLPGAHNSQFYGQMNHYMGQPDAFHMPTGQNPHMPTGGQNLHMPTGGQNSDMPGHVMDQKAAKMKLLQYEREIDGKKETGTRKRSCPYTGVRKREWGTYAAEIRNPKSGAREWLGTFDTAEEAAVMYDARLRQLKGPSSSRANFPELDQSGPKLGREICPLGKSRPEREVIQIPCNWLNQVLEFKKNMSISSNTQV